MKMAAGAGIAGLRTQDAGVVNGTCFCGILSMTSYRSSTNLLLSILAVPPSLSFTSRYLFSCINTMTVLLHPLRWPNTDSLGCQPYFTSVLSSRHLPPPPPPSNAGGPLRTTVSFTAAPCLARNPHLGYNWDIVDIMVKSARYIIRTVQSSVTNGETLRRALNETS